MDMNVGDCFNVWRLTHSDGEIYSWVDSTGPESRDFCDKVAERVHADKEGQPIRRIGVWRIKEIKS